MDAAHQKQIADAFAAQAQQLGSQRQLFHTGLGSLMTKMRPGAYALLEQLKDLYELHIYTMGDRWAVAGRRQGVCGGCTARQAGCRGAAHWALGAG